MSTEYMSIKDKGLARVEGKDVRIVGSLSDTFCQLLNEAFSNKEESKNKREFVSFESNSQSIIDTIYNSISSEDSDIVYITTPSEIDEVLTNNIKEDLSSKKGLHLITALTNNDNTLEEEKEELENIVQLESYVLENKGRVYRIVLGEADATY